VQAKPKTIFMKIEWIIEHKDIEKLIRFVKQNNNPFVKKIIDRNVYRQNLCVDKDSFLRNLIMCLLTSQQPSGPNTKVALFLQLDPFPLTYNTIKSTDNIENLIKSTMLKNGLNRFINKIPVFFSENFKQVELKKWELLSEITTKLNGEHPKEFEREIADKIDIEFKGFGPKQSRNFLQALGLTKYEVPIDSRITGWLNNFGFPFELTSKALQDKAYYHFVLDGFQELCSKAKLYPCVVDAAIFSSFDNGQWTVENSIY